MAPCAKRRTRSPIGPHISGAKLALSLHVCTRCPWIGLRAFVRRCWQTLASMARLSTVEATLGLPSAWVTLLHDRDIFVGMHADLFKSDRALFAEWADAGAWGPLHPAAQRAVTAHADFLPINIIDLGEEHGFQCIDLEYTCVTSAVYDLAHMLPACKKDSGKEQAFLTSYLEAAGEDASTWERLLVDCCLAPLVHLLRDGPMEWGGQARGPAGMRALLSVLKSFAAEVRGDISLQSALRQEAHIMSMLFRHQPYVDLVSK
eukprot:gnl/TRDRNA2_/TRDRNA2_72975_c0_seq1.p1 gnl/TRDRNA2_/TRDRNA2_72975_c0~~gnl/TRDRNA2_/TRDRNA2_72975_c0_seq1.p1  ORF type:complete len:261 (-),score=19.64 gnl/TRDRNA2_/TRDRNA2_72975_c0_seq1:85-867(-)